jgi:stage II sporulation protein D
MLIRSIITIFLLSSFSTMDAQVRVRLYYGEESESAFLRINDHDHILIVDGKEYLKPEPGNILFISRAGEKIALNILNESGVVADSISLLCETDTSYIDLSVPGLSYSRNEYYGNLTFSSSLGQLKIINTLDMDTYIAGVVQAEGGYKGHPEYFKTQAVIARTYAYLNLGKHALEGFDICDDVHCQVYHGRSVTGIIDKAVSDTKNQVLVDSDTLLIFTPFHSNCGGETVSSAYVWLTGLPYLVSVFDPYCGYSRNAVWKKDISRKDWLDYLISSGRDTLIVSEDFSFNQVSRKHSYESGDIVIPLTVLRSDFGLRSTFFTIKDNGAILHLQGRGYGHGVGLCQEGAMVMATRGFTYDQILNFYYNKVHITNIDSAIRLEKEELSF